MSEDEDMYVVEPPLNRLQRLMDDWNAAKQGMAAARAFKPRELPSDLSEAHSQSWLGAYDAAKREIDERLQEFHEGLRSKLPPKDSAP